MTLVHAMKADFDELGVPDNAIRRILLELAEVFDTTRDEQMAIAAAGIREMIGALHDAYRPKSPLQEQMDYLRARRELRELVGVELPLLD